jgi:glutathione S-transferase
MPLIGLNGSPYTRRVASPLRTYGIRFEQRALSGFSHREEVRTLSPLGRIPALVLDNGGALVDSGAIIDHLDEVYGRDPPWSLPPRRTGSPSCGQPRS